MNERQTGGPLKDDAFVVAFENFEGPLDLLLDLARNQKIDLRAISVTELADQFIEYLKRARGLRLEIAGEYLVMAAWLAYLKSKLLLPEPDEDGDDAEMLAEQLARRLRFLDSVRTAVVLLQSRSILGKARFAPADNQGLGLNIVPLYRSDLAKLLRAYASATAPKSGTRLRLRRRKLMSVQQALTMFSHSLIGDWRDIMSFLPPGLIDELDRNGAIAAHLVAGLELARQGNIEIDQRQPFGNIRVRRRRPGGPGLGSDGRSSGGANELEGGT